MNADADWHWAVSNAGPTELLLWLEPWADELSVPQRSTATLKVINPNSLNAEVAAEQTEDHIVIWGNGGDLIEVYIDGALQESASAMVRFPEFPGMQTRDFLQIVFGNQPTARLAGHLPAKPSIWQRIRRRLGI